MASIRPRGNKWRARVRRRGHEPISETFLTKAAAERWARKMEQAQEEGHHAPSAEAKRLTLGDALDRYKKDVTAHKRSAKQEEYRIALWKAHSLAKRPLVEITPSDIAAFRNARKAAKKAANTIRLELALISNLFNVARTEWNLPRLPNPVADTKKPSTVGTKRRRRLREGEEAKLLKGARATGPAWLPHIIIFAIETAMRRGEIARLQEAWIAGDIVEIPLTKNGEPRRVPMTARAQTALARMRKALGSLDDMPSVYTISAYFKRAVTAAGINNLRFHDMRREGTSRLFELGFGIEEVAAITGHKTWAILADYTIPDAEKLADKLAKKSPLKAGRERSGRTEEKENKPKKQSSTGPIFATEASPS